MSSGGGHDAGSVPTFADRQEAGARLADALMRFRDDDLLILGIPTGGVPVAAEVARRLGAELDLVIARKLGAPDQPELALGAVTAAGDVFIDPRIVANHDVAQEQLAAIIARETAQAKAREERYRQGRPRPRIARRTVIVVDDGLATGATLRATLRAVRAQDPAHLVAAVPIGSVDAQEDLQSEADEVVCLLTPDLFEAVSVHYDDFGAVSDRQLQTLLDGFTSGRGQEAGRDPSAGKTMAGGTPEKDE